jgi:hypothetical protein
MSFCVYLKRDLLNILTSRKFAWFIDGVWIEYWIYWHLIYTTRNYRQYNAIADLDTLQFTIAHTLNFSVFTSRILATDLPQSHCNFTYEVFFAPPNSFLAISPQSPSTVISRTRPNSWQLTQVNSFSTELSQLLRTNCSFGTSRYIASWRTPRKTSSSMSRVIIGVFINPLPNSRRLLLRALAPAGMCLTCRCLAMGLYVAICIWVKHLLEEKRKTYFVFHYHFFLTPNSFRDYRTNRMLYVHFRISTFNCHHGLSIILEVCFICVFRLFVRAFPLQ